MSVPSEGSSCWSLSISEAHSHDSSLTCTPWHCRIRVSVRAQRAAEKARSTVTRLGGRATEISQGRPDDGQGGETTIAGQEAPGPSDFSFNAAAIHNPYFSYASPSPGMQAHPYFLPFDQFGNPVISMSPNPQPQSIRQPLSVNLQHASHIFLPQGMRSDGGREEPAGRSRWHRRRTSGRQSLSPERGGRCARSGDFRCLHGERGVRKEGTPVTSPGSGCGWDWGLQSFLCGLDLSVLGSVHAWFAWCLSWYLRNGFFFTAFIPIRNGWSYMLVVCLGYFFTQKFVVISDLLKKKIKNSHSSWTLFPYKGKITPPS